MVLNSKSMTNRGSLKRLVVETVLVRPRTMTLGGTGMVTRDRTVRAAPVVPLTQTILPTTLLWEKQVLEKGSRQTDRQLT